MERSYCFLLCVFSFSSKIDTRVLRDFPQSQLLGTGKSANGSTLTCLAKAGFWRHLDRGQYDLILAQVLRTAHKHFISWMQTHLLRCSQPALLWARLSRRTLMQFSSLSSKGNASKVTPRWEARANLTGWSQRACTRMPRPFASWIAVMLSMDEQEAMDYNEWHPALANFRCIS